MKIAIIGSGISGLSAAAYSARQGHEVHVFEKNGSPGGRARQFTTPEGYTFDMGPSWYWMPDIIERFFNDFGHTASDFYRLVSLDPQFEMVFDESSISLPEGMDEMEILFESIEPGAGTKFIRFMEDAAYKYKIGMGKFVEKPCHSWLEFATPDIAMSALRMDLLTNYSSYVRKYFSNPRLIALMEFPVIFLGAAPKDIPALYSLMNYGGYALGTHYPIGGFYKLVDAMVKIALEQGVQFHFNSPVDKINTSGSRVSSLVLKGHELSFDAVIAACDYHHAESLLQTGHRNYSPKYWESRTFAPSCLIFYLGFTTTLPGLGHHTLFFDKDMDAHIDAIYKTPGWPAAPLFYVCCPSKTDQGVAPPGHENVFLLMPLATGIEDSTTQREKYLDIMLERLESRIGVPGLKEKMDFCQSYCVSDFVSDYNAFGGNAYGLANTLRQTAVLKPSLRNKKLKNLFYAGQLTVPGPGVPPSILSGKIVSNEILKAKNTFHEKTV